MKHFSGKLYMALAVAIFSYVNTFAQVPGYQGKRFMLNYNLHMTPNIYAYSTGDVPFRLYTKHMFEVEYVIGRKVTAALEGGFMKHNVPVTYEHLVKGSYDQYYSDKSITYEVQLSGFAVGGNFKFYNLFSKNTLAPLGSYLSLNGQFMQYNLTDKIGATKYEDLSLSDNQYSAVNASAAGIMMGVGFGTKRIYFDRVTVNLGFSANIAGVLPKLGSESDNYSGLFITKFVFNRHLLMYNIGIGGLLF